MRGPSARVEHCGMTKLSTPRDAAIAVVENPILPASTDTEWDGYTAHVSAWETQRYLRFW